VSPVKYELGFYIPENDIHHTHFLENLKSYKEPPLLTDVQTGPGADAASYTSTVGRFLQRLKRPRLEAQRSPQTSVEISN
jgi:hypothetical protein